MREYRKGGGRCYPDSLINLLHCNHDRLVQRKVKRKLQATGYPGKTLGQQFGVHPNNNEQPGAIFALNCHPPTQTRESQKRKRRRGQLLNQESTGGTEHAL